VQKMLFCIFLAFYLHMSEKSITFALVFGKVVSETSCGSVGISNGLKGKQVENLCSPRCRKSLQSAHQSPKVTILGWEGR